MLRMLCEFFPYTILPARELKDGFTRVILKVPFNEGRVTIFTFDVSSKKDTAFLHLKNQINDEEQQAVTYLWTDSSMTLGEQADLLTETLMRYNSSEEYRTMVQKVKDEDRALQQ